jgi:hypothetical protein
MIYHNQGKQANHYTTDAVHVWIMILNTLIYLEFHFSDRS